MTPEQVTRVKASWEQVKPAGDAVAGLFYGRLFQLDPGLEKLFTGDMTKQGRKLMSMIGTAVNSLDRLEAVLPAVQALGQRHAGYGVKDADYDTVGEALLWTLGEGLGDAYTPDLKAAWTETYTTLAGAMKEAAGDAT